MTATGALHFAYRPDWARWVVVAPLVALAWARVVRGAPQGGSSSRWLIFAAVWTVYWAAVLLYEVLLIKRGGVRLDDAGLTVADGLGRQASLAWGAVTECHRHTGFLGWWFRCPVEIRDAQGAKLQTQARTSQEPALVQTIAERAGLTETTRQWWGVRYTRPGG